MSQFKSTIEKQVELTTRQLHDYPFESEQFYENFLSQTYYYTKHSPKMLMKALQFIENQNVKQAFTEHASEEAGHHNLAKNDLYQLNQKKPQDFEELPNTKKLYLRVYEAIESEPYSILGYAMALEFLAVKACPGLIEQCQGHPHLCISFLDEHGELDIQHTENAYKLYETLAEDEKKQVEKYFHYCLDDYLNMCEEINTISDKGTQKAS